MRRGIRLIWRFAFRIYGRYVPLRFVHHFSPLLSWPLKLAGIRGSVALSNVSLAFPEKEERVRCRIARRSLENLVTVYLEMPRLGHMPDNELRRHFEIDNLEVLTDRTIDERGALLLSGHIGNWELLALGSARLAQRPFSIIVKGQDDFGELDRMRSTFGNKMIPLHKAALSASRILSKGGVVAMLADQSPPSTELPVTLFGVETTAFSTPARLALRYRPKVILGFAIRLADGRYRTTLSELPHNDLDDTHEGIELFTRRYLDALEKAIREYPEQWVWQHRRWKRSPGIKYD
ncbi:MAG: lysophospholipid acyltransferase family protein [Chlorobi bacterium]|nr:lysophospholipid acyltransferase family protein [Chlorobiota bacterium]